MKPLKYLLTFLLTTSLAASLSYGAGTSTTVLHGSTTGNSTYGPVNLKTDSISNTLLPINGANGSLNIAAYGAKSDGQQVHDASTTNSATSVITSGTGAFKASDVGKRCMVISSATPTPGQTKYGTVTAFTSTTQETCTLNGTPGATTNSEYIWGTDDTTAINNALTDAATLQLYVESVTIPQGISLFTSTLVIPLGVNLVGVSNTPLAINDNVTPSSLVWTGSTLILANGGSSDGIEVGDTPSMSGMSVKNLNIDCANLASRCTYTNAQNVTFDKVSIGRGYFATLDISSSAVVENSSIFSQAQGKVLKINPSDNRVINNYIFGAQTGYAVVELAGPDTVLANNHMWRPPDSTNCVGDMILVNDAWGNSLNMGSVLIANNSFDTMCGSGVNVNVQSNGGNVSTLQALNIIDNIAFQDDTVTNNTYSFITLKVDAGNSIRALNISGNAGQGSFNDRTKGQWKSFIDGTNINGTIYSATVTSNNFDNCNNLYSNFTPDLAADNSVIHGNSTTVELGTTILDKVTALNVNKVAITAPATAATLTIANNKTLTANNTLTLAGTDSTTMTFPSTSASVARTDAGQTFSGGNQVFIGASSPTLVTLGDASTTASSELLLRGNGSQKAWFVGSNAINAGALDFFQSTANGGTTAAGSAMMTLTSNGSLQLPSLTTSSAAQTGTVCWTTGTGNLTVDTTTTCLLSARKFKKDIQDLKTGLSAVMQLRPVSYHLKDKYNPTHLGEQVGFIADEVQKVDERFVSTEKDGSAHSVRYQQMVPLLVKAIQEQQKEIEALNDAVYRLKREK